MWSVNGLTAWYLSSPCDMRGPEWVSGSFSVIIRVFFVLLSPERAATRFMPASTLDLQSILLFFQTVDSNLSLSVFLLSASLSSTWANPLLLLLRLPSPFPFSAVCPLYPSLPVALRSVSLTLPDSSLKRRNRAPVWVTMMQNNKPCLQQNYCSDPFFTSSDLFSPPDASLHLSMHVWKHS